MKYLNKLFTYLRINDEQGRLSLTNLLIYIMVYKFATAETTMLDVGALGAVIVNYMGKRWLTK